MAQVKRLSIHGGSQVSDPGMPQAQQVRHRGGHSCGDIQL
jgi:hypothetical protein